MKQLEPDGRTNLPALADIFHALRRGRHISSADGALFTHLCAHYEAYRVLLEDLGFTLRRHPREFFYLEDTSNFTDIAGKMALFIFILVENLADRGLPIEDTLMSSTFAADDLPHLTGDRYRELMREAEVTSVEQLGGIILGLDRYGFIRRLPDDRFGFLPPAYRFLDLCLQYAGTPAAKTAMEDGNEYAREVQNDE
jgi:hypothetical protein